MTAHCPLSTCLCSLSTLCILDVKVRVARRYKWMGKRSPKSRRLLFRNGDRDGDRRSLVADFLYRREERKQKGEY